MKKNIVLILISLLILCSNISCAIENENKDTNLFDIKDGIISICIPVGKVEHEKTINGDEISIDDFGRLLVPGKPNIPSKIISIAIPPDAKVIDVNFKVESEVVLPGNYQIINTQLPKITYEKDSDVYLNELSQYTKNYENVYSSNNPYPSSIVEFVQSSGYRKYNLVDVRVNPLTYFPLNGKLIYYPEIIIDISYTFEDDFSRKDIMIDDIKRTEGFAEKIVYNYEQAKYWYPQNNVNKDSYDYVIITLDSLETSIDSLVDWEETKGKSVKVVTTTWIDSNYAGYDLAEKMRNFLREKYPSEEWGVYKTFL
jgi:hypothetical protein